MGDVLKTFMSVLMKFPAIGGLLQKAVMGGGKIDPKEAINALSSISSDTSKCFNAAANSSNRQEAVKNMMNIGEVEINNKKVNTKTVISDLRNVGEPNSIQRKIGVGLANILEQLPNKSDREVNEFGAVVSDTNNWGDLF